MRKRKKKQRVGVWKQRREEILKYYGYKCYYCGYDRSKHALEIHHLYNNKDHTPQNCIVICANCHRIQTALDKELRTKVMRAYKNSLVFYIMPHLYDKTKIGFHVKRTKSDGIIDISKIDNVEKLIFPLATRGKYA